jgi:hypothetical protein
MKIEKNSFVLYKSFYKPICELSDKQLGRLFRAIYCYQLGEVFDVESDISMAFNFFRNQFELDEEKYRMKVERDIENGRKGGNPKFKKGHKNPYYKSDDLTVEKITQDNPPLSDITQDNHNDNENDNVINKETSTNVEVKKDELSLTKTMGLLEKRSENFKKTLEPFEPIYGDMIQDFYDYWTEPNKSHTKMRFELEQTWDTKRRLNTWDRREKIKHVNYADKSKQYDRRRGSDVEATSAEDFKRAF